MAASQAARRKTVSRCIAETDRCTHVFEIAGYSLLKGSGADTVIRSSAFVAGGGEWCIRFYPEGRSGEPEDAKDYVAVYLELLTKNTEVRTLFDFRLLDPATGQSLLVLECRAPTVFNAAHVAVGSAKFKKRADLEASEYLQDDCLVIECNLTVITGAFVIKSEASHIHVIPSDLPATLGKCLESGKRADVTFKVKEEVFHSHKFVLALRSPVFEAEFYGPMGDKAVQSITVEDMQPDVFKALLHFIYTDLLPPTDDLDEIESQEMVKHLLVAADRYAMERMKLMCESILSKMIDVESVAATLALADQYHCKMLKDACIEFINSLDSAADLVASKGYEHLKRSCPDVFMDIWERAAKSRKL